MQANPTGIRNLDEIFTSVKFFMAIFHRGFHLGVSQRATEGVKSTSQQICFN